MPAGPGHLEGEPFSTLVLELWSLDSSQDEDTSDENGSWAALFRGPFLRSEVTPEMVTAGMDNGYDMVEMGEATRELHGAAAAILRTDDRGFYYGSLYSDLSEAEADFKALDEDYHAGDEPE